MFSLVFSSAILVLGVVGLPPVIIKQPVESEILFKPQIIGTEHRREYIKSLEVHCEADGDPLPKYRWTKDSKEFNVSQYSDRIKQKPDGGTLTFIKPVEEDAGEYLCFAENKDGIAKSNQVTLRKAFLENFDNHTVEEVEVTEDETFKLECEAPNGYPKPSLFWMIQTAQGAIKGIDNPRVTLDPTGNLWFSPVNREDFFKDSYYVCSAASSAANEYKLGNRIMLKVIPRTSKSYHPPTLQYTSPQTISALRGKTTELFCIHDGTPMPKIAWSKDGKSITHDERVFLENYGKSLKIKRTDVKDEGKYTCDVSSEAGDKLSSEFHLNVGFPPRFSIEPHSKNATLGETIELKCEAVGAPKPSIQWFINGKLIEHVDSTRLEFSQQKLLIRDAKSTDVGNYACYATNMHGFVFKDIYVNVAASITP